MDHKKKNFTEVEKNLLTSILVQYKDIIENKKTDGASVKVKNAAWENVATKFNASQLINEKANTKQLQRLWTNMKQRQRDALTQERQHRLSTGGGTSIGDVLINPNVSMVAPNLMVEVSGAVDSDSGFVVFDEDSLEFFGVEDRVAQSQVLSEESHKELPTDVDSGPPKKVIRIEAAEPKSMIQNLMTSGGTISSTSNEKTVPLAPPSQPPLRRLSSRSMLRSPSPVTSANRKDILMQQEAECRMRREEQLMTLENVEPRHLENATVMRTTCPPCHNIEKFHPRANHCLRGQIYDQSQCILWNSQFNMFMNHHLYIDGEKSFPVAVRFTIMSTGCVHNPYMGAINYSINTRDTISCPNSTQCSKQISIFNSTSNGRWKLDIPEL